MKRILLTGMSGTGKSTVIDRLADLGYRAVDLDDPAWSEYDDAADWLWREDLVEQLLARTDGDLLFVSGCATNQVEFHSRFDHVVLLSAPAPVLMERLLTRTNNRYGKRSEERREVLHYLATVEPRLRRVADHEIVTTAPIEEVVSAVLHLAGERLPAI
jgi:dephospho-CoA kinase